ncbi:MAG: general secretion pathway protein GspG [Myxococcales bacterium]|nr:general secretion pathway protein GspG [Myxococcales bacterium]
MASRRDEKGIQFPWEKNDRWRLPWARTLPIMAALGMMGTLALFAHRERERAGIRSTRATLMVVREGLDNYRADHDGRCPDSLARLKEEGYLRVPPVDAWERPLALVCPGRRNPESYDLSSWGPSGDTRGLERVQ